MNYILLLGMPGGGELVFIVLIIIMLFGSKKIPELARGLGKGMREIKNATNDIQQEIREGAREVNNAKDFTNVEKQVEKLIKDEKETSEEKQQKEPGVEPDSASKINIKPPTNSVQREAPKPQKTENSSESIPEKE